MGLPSEPLSLFHRVSHIVNSELSLDEMLGQIVGLTSQASGCDACLVYLAESATGEFVLRASQMPHAGIGATRIKLGEGVTGWVAQHQTTVALSSGASADPRFKAFATLVEDTYEAFLSVPLVHKGKSIGVVNVHHRERHEYSESEIAAISFIGEQMSGAIANSMLEDENARLAERDLEQERHRLHLEAEVSRRTADLEAANAELRIAKDKAEEVARLKSEFLANMSHEIRTPIHGVLGMTELALDTELTAEQRDYLTIVKRSADSLLIIINEILDFSKVDAGKLELDPSEFAPRDLAEETATMLALGAHQKGIELVCEVDHDVPESVTGDARRIRQVLVNLIGNALKFTERGEVVLTVKVRAGNPAGQQTELLFTVRDTGIGIASEKLQNIFQAFYQADGSTTRRYGGTGLGLAISQRLVTLMGGKIAAESEPGRGSTFSFNVRVERGSYSPAAAPPDPATLRDMLVLVVDDNATNRRILSENLTRWGMRVLLAASGPAALELLSSTAEPIPLVLTDVHMPGMDGFELVQQIRRSGAAPVIVMLTSGNLAGDVARYRDLGVERYLNKPVGRKELQGAILGALKPPAAVAAGAVESAAGSLPARRLKILVAEDNLVNQKLAQRSLEKAGHSVVVAGNGREALNALDLEPFDLVLMDVQMPEMDGLEATAAIRERERSGGVRLPIVAMTAHAMAGDRERCLAAGMDGYLTKPIHPAELQAAIWRLSGE